MAVDFFQSIVKFSFYLVALKSFLPTIIGRQKVQLLKKRYSAGFGFPKVSLVIKLFNQKCRKKIHKTRLVSESQAAKSLCRHLARLAGTRETHFTNSLIIRMHSQIFYREMATRQGRAGSSSSSRAPAIITIKRFYSLTLSATKSSPFPPSLLHPGTAPVRPA